MKSMLVKLSLLGIILFSFSLQAFTPPLPNVTTVKLTNLKWYDANNNAHDYYEAKVTCWGPILTDQSAQYYTYNIDVSLPRDIEYFPTNYQHYTSSNCLPTGFSVSVKRTSTSSWEYLGSSTTEGAGCTRYYVDNYLYVVEWDMSQVCSGVPIEE